MLPRQAGAEARFCTFCAGSRYLRVFVRLLPKAFGTPVRMEPRWMNSKADGGAGQSQDGKGNQEWGDRKEGGEEDETERRMDLPS